MRGGRGRGNVCVCDSWGRVICSKVDINKGGVSIINRGKIRPFLRIVWGRWYLNGELLLWLKDLRNSCLYSADIQVIFGHKVLDNG
jgi:hypothetical protein